MFRGLLLALILATSAANAQGVSNDARGQQGTSPAQTKPESDAQPSPFVAIQNQIERIASAIEAANSKQPSPDEKNDTQRNLEAQEKIAAWAPAVFWVAFAELFVTVLGVLLVWRTLTETRRIGQAQVRAYVSVKSVNFRFVEMGVGQQPGVTLILKNSGSSPARHLGWNITVRYLSGTKRRTRSFIDVADTTKWARTHDIAASDTIEDSAIVAEMFIAKFAEGLSLRTVVNLRVDFVFLDVFDQEIRGEAYFSGLAQQSMRGVGGPKEWVIQLMPVPKPNDWDQPDSD